MIYKATLRIWTPNDQPTEQVAKAIEVHIGQCHMAVLTVDVEKISGTIGEAILGLTPPAPAVTGPWSGRRIRTRVADSNDVERGTAEIPVGWLATVGAFSGDHYTVNWDDGPEGDMGWCLWSEDELERDAEVILA